MRQFKATLVEFVVAEGHGVKRQMLVQCRLHGPFVDAVKERPLKLIARVQRDDVVVFGLGVTDGGGDARQPASARVLIKSRVARHMSMSIVGVQDDQFQPLCLLRGRDLARRAAGQPQAADEKE